MWTITRNAPAGTVEVAFPLVACYLNVIFTDADATAFALMVLKALGVPGEGGAS